MASSAVSGKMISPFRFAVRQDPGTIPGPQQVPHKPTCDVFQVQLAAELFQSVERFLQSRHGTRICCRADPRLALLSRHLPGMTTQPELCSRPTLTLPLGGGSPKARGVPSAATLYPSQPLQLCSTCSSSNVAVTQLSGCGLPQAARRTSPNILPGDWTKP